MRLLLVLLGLAILTAPLSGCIIDAHGGGQHWDHPPDDWHDHR
jgi:hypothetical protein